MNIIKRMLNMISERFSKALIIAFCGTVICGTGVTVAAVNMSKQNFKASASIQNEQYQVNVPDNTSVAMEKDIGGVSTLKQVNTTDDAVDSYKVKSAIKKAEYEQYLESIKREYVSPDISENEIVTMLNSDDETQIMSSEALDIGQEDTSASEHGNVEVVEEEGAELRENAALSYGIDVSHYQKEIDWAKVKASGIDFALIKCGGRSVGDDANLYQDSFFDENIQGALANGIQVGVYFFSQAVSVKEAYEEASYCVNLIDKYQITYPVAFDWESSDGYRVNAASLSRDELTQIVEVFCDTIEGCGYQPMVYFCRNDWYNIVNADVLTAKYKTWLAVYYNEYYYKSDTWQYGKSIAEFDYKYDCWQYGVSDSVPGIDGYVDMNVAFFSYSNYEVKGLQEPELNIDYKDIKIRHGDKWILSEGVYGVNSLGYPVDVKCMVGDTEYTDTGSLATGKYNLTYSFKDPRRGILKETATLTIYDNARIEIANPVPVINVGDKYDFLKGITAYDSGGKKVVPDYLITYNGTPVTNVKDVGTYRISYNFKDENQGVITAIVNLTVNEKTTSASTTGKKDTIK